jgi:hypothetical protein
MNKRFIVPALIILLIGSVAATWADILVLKNGQEHSGTLVSATSTTITFRQNGQLMRYPVDTVDMIQFGATLGASANNATSAAAPLASRQANQGPFIPEGTEIAIRANENINSETARENQTFSAEVAENVIDNSTGRVLIPSGSDALLIIRKIDTGGITGTAEMAIDLHSVELGDRTYLVETSDVEQRGESGIGANRRTAEIVGGGAAIGAIIGAIAGGGKGAAIGALGGAAAGTGVQILTRGKEVRVPAETILRFKVEQPLYLRGVDQG